MINPEARFLANAFRMRVEGVECAGARGRELAYQEVFAGDRPI
jgi:hypothetical protein